MNTSTCKKIGTGVVAIVAGSVLILSPDGADARMCVGAQDDDQCVVMPPTSGSTDSGVSGSGGTFVAGVFLPDSVTGDPRANVYLLPAEAYVPQAEVYIPDIVTGDPRANVYVPPAEAYVPQAEVYIPDIVTGDPRANVYVPPAEAYVPRAEVYIPDIVTGDPPADSVESTGDGCVGAPGQQVVACPE